MNEPNTLDVSQDTSLDEQIAVLRQRIYDVLNVHDKNKCSNPCWGVENLLALFTEHSKEVDRLARISEVESMAVLAVDIEELLPLLSARLNQLSKRNKGEDNGR